MATAPEDDTVPLTSNEFFDAFKLVVTRMELFPAVEPQGWMVGFTATCINNNFCKFLFTNVSLEEAHDKSHMEVVRLAWDKVAPQMLRWARLAIGKSPLMGNQVVFR